MNFGCSGLDMWQRGPYRPLPPFEATGPLRHLAQPHSRIRRNFDALFREWAEWGIWGCTWT